MRHSFPMNLVLSPETPPGIGLRTHLAEQLRQAVLSRSVAADEPLPSSRLLAQTLGVSRGTVIAVYEDLCGEGYLVSVPGGGTFVAPGILTGALAAAAPAPLASEASFSPAEASAREPRINLWPGSPSTRFHNSREWTSAWKRALSAELPATPPPTAGLAETRALLADHLRVARGMRCSAEDVILTAGTSDGLGLLAHALLDAGTGARVAVENPGYRAARQVFTRVGVEAVPVPVRDGGMDLAALERSPGAFSGVMLTPSHQYPLGGRLPIAARLAALDWARRHDAIVIEDDYDSEFRHGAQALPAIASLDDDHRVVLVGSTSKTLTPWLRCGYLVVTDPELRGRLLAVREDLGQPVSGVVQLALAEFLRSGGLRRHLARVGREYAHRRGLVIAALDRLTPRATLLALEGGLHATVTWSGGASSATVVRELDRRGIRVAPLDNYAVAGGPKPGAGIVFGYGAPGDLQLVTALEQIAAVLDALLAVGPVSRA